MACHNSVKYSRKTICFYRILLALQGVGRIYVKFNVEKDASARTLQIFIQNVKLFWNNTLFPCIRVPGRDGGVRIIVGELERTRSGWRNFSIRHGIPDFGLPFHLQERGCPGLPAALGKM